VKRLDASCVQPVNLRLEIAEVALKQAGENDWASLRQLLQSTDPLIGLHGVQSSSGMARMQVPQAGGHLAKVNHRMHSANQWQLTDRHNSLTSKTDLAMLANLLDASFPKNFFQFHSPSKEQRNTICCHLAAKKPSKRDHPTMGLAGRSRKPRCRRLITPLKSVNLPLN
jgi:hypothetical protein